MDSVYESLKSGKGMEEELIDLAKEVAEVLSLFSKSAEKVLTITKAIDKKSEKSCDLQEKSVDVKKEDLEKKNEVENNLEVNKKSDLELDLDF